MQLQETLNNFKMQFMIPLKRQVNRGELYRWSHEFGFNWGYDGLRFTRLPVVTGAQFITANVTIYINNTPRVCESSTVVCFKIDNVTKCMILTTTQRQIMSSWHFLQNLTRQLKLYFIIIRRFIVNRGKARRLFRTQIFYVLAQINFVHLNKN